MGTRVRPTRFWVHLLYRLHEVSHQLHLLLESPQAILGLLVPRFPLTGFFFDALLVLLKLGVPSLESLDGNPLLVFVQLEVGVLPD